MRSFPTTSHDEVPHIPTRLMADLLDIFNFESEDDERRMFHELYDVLWPYWVCMMLLLREGVPTDATAFTV